MIEFVVEKKLFDSAMKQLLFGRSGTSEDIVDLTVERSTLTLVATGTTAQVPVVSDATESLSIKVGDLAKIKKVSSTYKGGPCVFASGTAGFDFRTPPLA